MLLITWSNISISKRKVKNRDVLVTFWYAFRIMLDMWKRKLKSILTVMPKLDHGFYVDFESLRKKYPNLFQIQGVEDKN